MIAPLTVFVPGVPAPQGSKTHVGGGRLIESSRSLAGWREAIALRVRSAMNHNEHPGWDGDAVEVVARFYFRRPRTVRRAEVTVKPDVDKLARALLDGLTDSGLVHDDAQVVRLVASKHYAETARPTGVLVHARPFGAHS